MNILLINHYAGSKYHGMAYRPYYLAREWVRSGHNVTIIAADQSHGRPRKVYIPEKKEYLIEKIDGINYLWLRTIKYNDNGIKRAINMASFIFQIFKFSKNIVNSFKPQIVIASSTYPADIFPAHYIANLSKAKLIYEIHDLWPLSPMILGKMSKNHPFILGMQFAENYCYKHSDAVVSILPKVSEHVKEHGLPLKKLYFVENGICIEEWKESIKIPEQLNQIINSEKSNGNFIFGYAGNHTHANSLHTIIEAAEKVKNYKARFILVGKGREKDNLINLATQKKLKNIIFYDFIPKETIPNLLTKFDCLLITWNNTWELYKYGISPNKIMDYMISGKPIIQSINAGNDHVKDSGCGFSVPAEDSEALASAIIKMMNTTEDKRNQMGEKGKEYVIKNYDYKVLAQKFLTIMKNLL